MLKTTSSGFISRPMPPASKRATPTCSIATKTIISLISIRQNRIDPQGTWNGPAAEFATVGVRVKSTPEKLGNWDYTAELAVQGGDVYQTDKNSARQDLVAFASHVNAGYTFKETRWKPRFALEYDFASGDDDPTDGDSHSFQNLFPSNHEKYGFMDEFSWRNIHDLRVQTSAKPAKGWEVGLDYHAFFLADTHDYWYRSNGISTLRIRTPDGETSARLERDRLRATRSISP